jgi:hypothetical protein
MPPSTRKRLLVPRREPVPGYTARVGVTVPIAEERDRLFVAGLDLGQVGDDSALVVEEVFEPVVVDGRSLPLRFELIYAERHQHQTYPWLVRHVCDVLRRAPLYGRTVFALDGTGVGRPIVQMFVEARAWAFPPGGRWVYPVVITPSGKLSAHDGWLHVSKTDLVAVAQRALQPVTWPWGERLPRLRFAERLTLTPMIAEQFKGFRSNVAKAGKMLTFEAWHAKLHDDFVIAPSIATLVAELTTARRLAPSPESRVRWTQGSPEERLPQPPMA